MPERKASKPFGDFYWASGPIFIGSKRLAEASKARDPKLLDALKKETKAPVSKTLFGETTVVFGAENKPSVWLQGDDGGVLVRVFKHCNPPQLKTVLAAVPEQVPADGWKRKVLSVKLSGDAQRFFIDPWSNHPAKNPPAPIPVKLGAGEWEIDEGVVGKEPLMARLFVFRRKGAVLAAAGDAPPVPQQPTVTLEASTKKAAKGLRFVETEGGPVMALPVAVLKTWKGVCDAEGNPIYGQKPTDYDRACDVKGPLLKLGGGVEALVLDQESTAFFKASDEVSYFLRWIGADHASHVLQAVLSAGPKAFKFTGKTFTLSSKGGLAVIDSAEFGPDVKKPAVADLKPGRYQLDEMIEFDGELIDGKKRHGLMPARCGCAGSRDGGLGHHEKRTRRSGPEALACAESFRRA